MPWAPRKEEEFIPQVVRTSCLHCEEWEHFGPTEEGRLLHEQHRIEDHGIVIVKKFRQSRRSPWKSKKALEENITNARAEGAAVWASDEGGDL